MLDHKRETPNVWRKGHFRVAFCLCFKPSLRAKPFIWEYVPLRGSFSCKSNSFSYERFCMKTHFETEAQDNSEMARCVISLWLSNIVPQKRKLTSCVKYLYNTVLMHHGTHCGLNAFLCFSIVSHS